MATPPQDSMVLSKPHISRASHTLSYLRKLLQPCATDCALAANKWAPLKNCYSLVPLECALAAAFNRHIISLSSAVCALLHRRRRCSR